MRSLLSPPLESLQATQRVIVIDDCRQVREPPVIGPELAPAKIEKLSAARGRFMAFRSVRLVDFWWRPMALTPVREDRRVVNFSTQAPAPEAPALT
jgi:hypothetical protein